MYNVCWRYYMAYQALYRKYRPDSFDDFIDQDNIKKILINSIKNNKVSHAYLFSGPRGIGKTSMASIFAKAINCDHFLDNDDVCNKCNNCIDANNNSVDIIEIDAASNNGVDQIRDLKSKISIVPSNLKYKVGRKLTKKEKKDFLLSMSEDQFIRKPFIKTDE